MKFLLCGITFAIIASSAWFQPVLASAAAPTEDESTIEQSRQLFFPLFVSSESTINRLPEPKSDHTFQVDQSETVTRLRHVAELGGASEDPEQCGQGGQLEVHVFGPSGAGNRLNDVLVEVTHIDTTGHMSKEIRWTGRNGEHRGVVTFELSAQADVRILADETGKIVSSDSMAVSSIPRSIPQWRLIQSAYCSDDTSCQRFIESRSCEGNVSWNIAFKRQ